MAQLELFEWCPLTRDEAPASTTVKRGVSDEQKERLYACARTAGLLGDQMLKSINGADQADSEAYFCERRVYVAVADGTPLDEALATEDRRWRAYAAEQAKKIAAAPKITRGPSSGWSTIAHRWVDPDKFSRKFDYIRFMVTKALEG